jgi:uncharacterized protein (TIGR00725 family)
MITRQVAVCGPAECPPDQARAAAEVGRLLAARGATVLCGGGSGVMAAVAEGAHAAGGLVIAVRPDARRDPDAPHTAVVASGLGQARNVVLVNSADAVIAIGGSWGTLSEVALACRRGDIPVVVLDGWTVLDGSGRPVPDYAVADTPAAAVDLALGPP